MNIYFIVLTIIYILNIGIALGKHGEEKVTKYNWLITFIRRTIGFTLVYFAIKTGF